MNGCKDNKYIDCYDFFERRSGMQYLSFVNLGDPWDMNLFHYEAKYCYVSKFGALLRHLIENVYIKAFDMCYWTCTQISYACALTKEGDSVKWILKSFYDEDCKIDFRINVF